MIATPHLVYIHLHKSGGTFVNECLLRFFPGARQLGYHLPSRLIPPELHTLPVLGFVRNPWSYYVSWYSFQAQMAQPNPLFLCVSENRRLDFAGSIRNLLELGDDDSRLDALLARLPATYGNRGLNLPGFALAPIRGSGTGFYSFLFDYMYGPASPALTIGRVESLRSDLLAFLDRLGIGGDPSLRAYIEEAAPRNASRHASIRDYYSEELAALVAHRERTVIERFGYRFAD
jgi:hypothetical protein